MLKVPSRRDFAEIGAFTARRLLQSLAPSNRRPAVKRLSLDIGGRYFENMSDPYQVFTFNVPDGRGGMIQVKKSTADIMLIEQRSYVAAQQALASVLEGLENAGIISPTPDGFEAPTGLRSVPMHLRDASALLTAYPHTNDVYFPDTTRRIEGMAVPKGVAPMYLTWKAMNPEHCSDETIIGAMTEILSAVRLLHGAANANAMMSPAVHIAINRLGYTDYMFSQLDAAADSPLVPKMSTGRPRAEILRGAWSDNRYYNTQSSLYNPPVYSDKNLYVPAMGAKDAVGIELYRDGPMGARTTKYANPCFPEWFKPVHFADFAASGSAPSAGFIVQGSSDWLWLRSIRTRRAAWSFADTGELTAREGRVWVSDPTGPDALYRNLAYGTADLNYFTANDTADAQRTGRRLRDWYLTYKPRDEVKCADAMTDFATLVQLARYMRVMPPHVLLHSVMGYHNALLKCSFEFVGVPFSTSLAEYQTRMRVERDAIATLAANSNVELVGGMGEPGFALTVKPPDSVILSDAGLTSATVASLQVGVATCAINPVVGVVCLALTGIAILIAELTGGRTQALITPYDPSRETLRNKRNAGLRSTFFRGMTPEYVVNASPVMRIP